MAIFLPFMLISCTNQSDSSGGSYSMSIQEDLTNKTIRLKVDNDLVDVSWEENESVEALKDRVKDGLAIRMRKYGDFEQVGSLMSTLPSNDTRITTKPGDICLYSSNQIVVFYAPNTWEYTKLGHINLDEDELNSLLGHNSVTLVFDLAERN